MTELSDIRLKLGDILAGMKDRVTHSKIPELVEKLGLGDASAEEARSKAERLAAALAATPDHKLPEVAERLLEHYPPHLASERNALQDAIWPDGPPVSKRARRDVANSIDIKELFLDAAKFDELIWSLFDLGDQLWECFIGDGGSLRGQIRQHVHQNPGDWTTAELFERLGALDVSDRRFATFVEGLASPEVRPDEDAQRRFVTLVNTPLRTCGVELQETGSRDGYPTFQLAELHAGSQGKPKNLIFASPEKPDLRFRDAVTNDIEIVTNADKVLVYDRPISSDGITWDDLLSWWKSREGITEDGEAKKSLYRRLLASLPGSSPPQRLLFDTYHREFGKRLPKFPALLPEVWLHWDPQTVRNRGAQALARSRMDFLMLLRHNVRLVIEVDGKQHYSVNDVPSPKLYSEMVAADRELKLDGYHVFRFGGLELNGEQGVANVTKFFEAVFRKFGVLSA